MLTYIDLFYIPGVPVFVYVITFASSLGIRNATKIFDCFYLYRLKGSCVINVSGS